MFKKWNKKKAIFVNDNGPLKFYLDNDFGYDYVYKRWMDEIKVSLSPAFLI